MVVVVIFGLSPIVCEHVTFARAVAIVGVDLFSTMQEANSSQ